MFHGWNEFFGEVFRFKFQAGGVDAGMTGEILLFQHFFVHDEPDFILTVVHQAHHSDRTGGQVQQLFHHIGRAEREA